MKNLKTQYLEDIRPALKSELGLKNEMEIPKLTKVCINMALGDILGDAKKIEAAHDELMLIAGQKPVITKAKKSIAGFKLREGMSIGLKVTLRKDRMYQFLERFIYIALPRSRDFRGLSLKSFDGKGNYTLGIKEHIIFPEINYDKIDRVRGFDITVCTTAKNNKEAQALLKALHFPFTK